MKVFAEYIKENGIEYRRKTLLQFGDNWDLIGSAVLKNPGSAKPQRPINEEEFIGLKDFFCNSDIEDEWHSFDIRKDSTIQTFLPKLFNGYYAVGKEKELKGVIQLFNLFYIREVDINKAVDKIENNESEFIYQNSEDIIPLLKDKPFFLGWGDKWNLNSKTRKLAKDLFEFQKRGNNKYLESNFEDNNFYHPQYLNIAYSGRAKGVVTSFWNTLK